MKIPLTNLANKTKSLLLLGVVFMFSFSSLIGLLVASHEPHTPFSAFDAYYHAQVSYDIAQGNEPQKPLLHPNQESSTTTLYWGYHEYLSLFMPSQPQVPMAELIWRIKVAHALLLGMFVTTIFFVIFKLISSKNAKQKLLVAATGSTLAMIAGIGISRFITERPHVVAVMLSLWVFYAVVKKQRILLFLIGIISSLLYAFVPLIGIPAYIALLTTFFYKKEQKDLFQKERFFQVLTLLGGFAAGTLLRPDSWYHLYNGTFLHMQELTNHALGQAAMQIQELEPGMFTFVDLRANLVWFVLLVLGLGAGFLILQETKSAKEKDLAAQLVTMNAFFFLMSLAFTRTTEYWYPIGVITGVVLIYKATQIIGSSMNANSREFIESIPKKLKFSLVASVGASIIVFGSLYVLVPLAQLPGTWLDPEFETAAKVLEIHSKPGDVVTNSSFSLYPHLYITNPQLEYQFGFSDIFSVTADPEKHWTMLHITSGDQLLCATMECTEENSFSIEEALWKLESDFLFIDLYQSGLSILNYRTLEAAENATRIYKSWGVVGPRIIIYKIEKPLP